MAPRRQRPLLRIVKGLLVKYELKNLYHLAEASNYGSILEHGLMSTSNLAKQVRLPARERAALLRSHRAEGLRISEAIMIRDQKPMPPNALAPALGEGLTPSDWYELLNGFVFFWADRNRVDRHLKACGGRPQVLLTFDSKAIIKDLGRLAFVSPINSGNARRKAAFRDRDTFVPYATWSQSGWPTGNPSRKPAEFCLACRLPVKAPYLIATEQL